MLNSIKAYLQNGYQTIDEYRSQQLPERFRGLPVIETKNCPPDCNACADACPTNAIQLSPVSIDLGKCLFCPVCEETCPEQKIRFTNQYLLGSVTRENLVVSEGKSWTGMQASDIRSEIHQLFGRSLKLRQISAAGDNACELELNASGNINFDFMRFGIDFVASPRHADGVLITGPISENMAYAVEDCWNAVPNPKILILCGTDAISGGLFANSAAIDRSFLQNKKPDLYIPGNPPHPLTIINAIRDLIVKSR